MVQETRIEDCPKCGTRYETGETVNWHPVIYMVVLAFGVWAESVYAGDISDMHIDHYTSSPKLCHGTELPEFNPPVKRPEPTPHGIDQYQTIVYTKHIDYLYERIDYLEDYIRSIQETE